MSIEFASAFGSGLRKRHAAGRAAVLAAAIAVTALAGMAYSAPAEAAEITIGANVNQQTSEAGTCGSTSVLERPCLVATSVIPGQTMASPCDGTITRFRINGLVRPANHYSLRVIRDNGNGTYTGTATSAPVAISVEGVNEYSTSLPISTGEGIGIDFLDSLENFGIRWVGGTQVKAGYFYAFPADGTPAAPTGPATFYYLVNADVACTPPVITPPPPKPALPSNEFSVVKLKKTKLTLNLASAGTVSVTDAKAKSKSLKPSSASGGPGQVDVTLKLTAAAKKTLAKKGKVKARATITFTPTGGTASTQSRTLTVRKAKKSSKAPGGK